MSKKYYRIFALCLALCTLLCLFACGPADGGKDGQDFVPQDLAATVKLDDASATRRVEATVKTYVDGDTTHFYVSDPSFEGGVVKARYLAINTPESTGKIEEWGKAASNFTREKLQNATSIILESDTASWDLDSTGDRYLLWVWYRSEGDTEYRNLNIEILQNGLAIASNSANNRYGEVCMAAIDQAKQQKLHIYSGEKDPNFPYGQATELTLKELRCNVTAYEGCKVAFEGVVTKDHGNTVYIEEYDAETDMYYGMTVYYGFALNGSGLQILSTGNRVRIVGTVQYYETGDSYQVSGLEYSAMRPKDPNNIQKISEGHSPAYRLTDAETFKNAKITVTEEEESKTFDYAELALYTSIEMHGLKVKSCSTTQKEDSSSKGAISLRCEVDGKDITVRTVVLYDERGELVTQDLFEGATIDVKGLVDRYKGEYQIKVFSIDDITIR